MIPQLEKPQLLPLEQIQSPQLGLAHAIKRSVGSNIGDSSLEDVLNVGGEVENEEEEGKDDSYEVAVSLHGAQIEPAGAEWPAFEAVDLEGGPDRRLAVAAPFVLVD